MPEIIMKVRINDKIKGTSMLCGFVLKGSRGILGLEDSHIDESTKQAISDIGGKFGSIRIVPSPKSQYKRLLVAGLGKKSEMTGDSIRFISGKIAQKASEIKADTFSIVAPPDTVVKTSLALSHITEGCIMSLYRFDEFKSEKKSHSPDLVIVAPKSKENSDAVNTARVVSEGVVFAKDVANLPPNKCTPSTLADISKKIAGKKMKCRILSKTELKRNGFGGISAVGQGSKNEPRLIILEHNGGPRNQKPIVLVGKAVTFDTGGISLKPGTKMDEMKFDKCGGCTVLGIMKTVSELKMARNIVGIIPSVENMPGGESYRPGDIIRLYSGKTAEILNTDAEGRLILADAISYGERHYAPSAIIDLATLTGACIIALGTNVAGMISNDQMLASKISKSSRSTTEQVWEMPLNDDYMDMIKSDVADMRNMGIGKAAGTIAAAAFLRNAVEHTPWAHLDIAGVAWTQEATKEKPYNPKGATGFGVRLITDYLKATD